MRSASRCQPGRAFAGQLPGASPLTKTAWVSVRALPPPQPASASTPKSTTPSRFTAPLKPVNRYPGSRASVARVEVIHELRTDLQSVVEGGLARIVRACGQHTVGDRARDDDDPDSEPAQARKVAVLVELPLWTGKLESKHAQALEARRGRVDRS